MPLALRQLAADDFARADGGLGSAWTSVDVVALQIASGQVRETNSPDGADGIAYYNAITWPNDQWSRIQVIATSANRGVYPHVRQTSNFNAGNTGSMYFAYIATALGSSTQIVLAKFLDHNYSELWNSGTTLTVASGDYLDIRVSGDGTAGNPVTVSCWLNGNLLQSAVDSSSPLLTGNAGIGVADNVIAGSSSEAILDNWSGGDFVDAGAFLALPYPRRPIGERSGLGGIIMRAVFPPQQPALPTAANADAAPSLSDTASGSDSVSVAASIQGSEAGAGSDTGTIAVALSPADPAAGSESESTGLVISDSGAASDAATLASAIAATDSGAGAETAALTVAIAASDAGSGSEFISVDTGSTQIGLSDSGAGSESVAIAGAVATADAAAAGDAGAVAAAFSGSDSAAGFDSASKGVLLGDGASGIEALVAAIVALLSDSAQGSDSIVVGGAPPLQPQGRASSSTAAQLPRADVRTGPRRGGATSKIRRG